MMLVMGCHIRTTSAQGTILTQGLHFAPRKSECLHPKGLTPLKPRAVLMRIVRCEAFSLLKPGSEHLTV